ncbi:MAG TPA: hypothetical protein PLQ56_21340 [Aggregatilineales bacterium]|nr:hypothetical protein [Aggregatilineales bacterium]
MMVNYQDVITLAEQLPLVERVRLIEDVSASLSRDLEIEAFRRMPWQEFIERTAGILADDPIERPAQLPLESREPIE